MATHSSILAQRIPWTEEPGGPLSIGSHKVGHDRSGLACMHALEKEMATYSSVLAWRIPGTEAPSWLPSMGSHRVGHTEATQQQQAVLLQVQLHGITATIPIHKCRVITRLPSCYTPIATSSSLYPCLWESINLFSISVIMLFHECCISGVMQHIHFQP